MHLATAHSWAQSLNCLVMIAGAFILSYRTKKSCIARLLHPCFFWIWFRGCFLSETAPIVSCSSENDAENQAFFALMAA